MILVGMVNCATKDFFVFEDLGGDICNWGGDNQEMEYEEVEYVDR